MNSIILALSFLAAAQAGSDWTEVRFHRVHLRNGNFIDGTVVADKPGEVVLLMKSGEMSIRRDQVDRVEVMKMKSYNDKPILLATPKGGKETPAVPVKPKTPDATSTPGPDVDTPAGIRQQVDQIVLKFRNQTGAERQFPAEEIQKLGDSAIAYLASKVPEMELNLSDFVMQGLIVMKTQAANSVLVELLKHDKPTVRSFAATVLGVQGDSERKQYIKPLLSDKDARVRSTAVSLLGSVQEAEWLDPISELCGDDSKDVRGPALTLSRRLAVKNGMQERLLRVLATNLTGGSDAVKADCAATIGGLGVAGSWVMLTPGLTDRDASVRAAAANSLLTLAQPECGTAVVDQIARETDKEPAVVLLGLVTRLRLNKATESVINLLDHADGDVRNSAETTLRTLSGENLGSSREAWTNWYKTSKK